MVATRIDPQFSDICAAGRGRIRVALDPEGKLAARLNAHWKPRAYVTGPDGRLRYIQPDTTMDTMAMEEAGAYWRSQR